MISPFLQNLLEHVDPLLLYSSSLLLLLHFRFPSTLNQICVFRPLQMSPWAKLPWFNTFFEASKFACLCTQSFLIQSRLVTTLPHLKYFISTAAISILIRLGNTHVSHSYVTIGRYTTLNIFLFASLHSSFLFMNPCVVVLYTLVTFCIVWFILIFCNFRFIVYIVTCLVLT